MSLENELAEMAEAAETVEAVPTKKARKPRGQKHAAEGEAPTGEAKPPRERKPRASKLVPQLDEEGNPVLDEEGNAVMVAPEKKVAVRAPRHFYIGSEEVDLHEKGGEVELTVVNAAPSREGSKRAERAKSLEGAATVQDFFINKGVVRDLHRLVKMGHVTLSLGGHAVTAVPVVED